MFLFRDCSLKKWRENIESSFFFFSHELFCIRTVAHSILITVSGQLPTRTVPHHTGIGPDEWFYWMLVVLVGSCPRDGGPGGQ